MFELGIIVPAECPWGSPIVVVTKPESGTAEWAQIRISTDFRRANALTEADPLPLPRVEDLLEKVGRAKFMTKLDMTKGYRQVL